MTDYAHHALVADSLTSCASRVSHRTFHFCARAVFSESHRTIFDNEECVWPSSKQEKNLGINLGATDFRSGRDLEAWRSPPARKLRNCGGLVWREASPAAGLSYRGPSSRRGWSQVKQTGAGNHQASQNALIMVIQASRRLLRLLRCPSRSPKLGSSDLAIRQCSRRLWKN